MNKTPTLKLNPSSAPSPRTTGWVMVGVLLMGSLAHADKWTYFFPEAVTRFSCKVEPEALMKGRDANESYNAYVAEARAERSANLGIWSMSISEQPETPKGRRKALKACANWMDEAEKRVKAAAPIRIPKKSNAP